MKWQNEVSRFLKVDIQIQQNIVLHRYFNVNLKIKNISLVKMDLDLEISDSSSEYINDTKPKDYDYFNFKNKRYLVNYYKPS